MTDIILHIGANKTGSSSIQSFIRKNAQTLRELGFVIPNNALELADEISGEHVFALQSYIGAGVDASAELKEKIDSLLEARETETQTLLLSGENMGTGRAADVFKAALADRRAKVIFYIRRQDELIESSWQQWYSKIHEDFDAWIIEAVRTLGHWEQVLKQWEACVGRDNIVLEVFEPSKFPQGNIIRDFAEKLGLAPHESRLELDLQDANPTHSEYITPMVSGNTRIFKNVHDNEFYRLVSELTGDRYTRERKVSLMSRQQRENIVKYFSSQNERIRQTYFPDRPDLFSAIDHEKYNYMGAEEMRDRQMKFLTTMMFEIARKQS